MVHGESVEITVYLKPNTKAAWFARGDYRGKNYAISKAAPSANAAAALWQDMVRYHTN